MRMIAVICFAVWAGGCATYTEAQMRLTEQARRGVEVCRQAETQRGQLVQQLQQSQRTRLEEAFDADVREQAALSAEWVIEHRKAYALALEAMGQQQAASREAQAAVRDNLEAIDAALQRLLMLQGVQLRLTGLEDLFRPAAGSGAK